MIFVDKWFYYPEYGCSYIYDAYDSCCARIELGIDGSFYWCVRKESDFGVLSGPINNRFSAEESAVKALLNLGWVKMSHQQVAKLQLLL